MPRGPLKEKTKKKQAIQAVADTLGISYEEAEDKFFSNTPVETDDDKAREAESVILYFEHKNEFLQKECKQCGGVFAYTYSYEGVAYCSNPCRKNALANIGIQWNPTKAPHERWGRYMPAVVPPKALEIIDMELPE